MLLLPILSLQHLVARSRRIDFGAEDCGGWKFGGSIGSRWWVQICVYFHPYLRKIPMLTIYIFFATGLKPPTRDLVAEMSHLIQIYTRYLWSSKWLMLIDFCGWFLLRWWWILGWTCPQLQTMNYSPEDYPNRNQKDSWVGTWLIGRWHFQKMRFRAHNDDIVFCHQKPETTEIYHSSYPPGN